MTIKQEQPYIDFYKKHKISPVSQDISDLEKHYSRRETLYRHLGIIPSFIMDKSVLEFGPGSGHNALYTHNLQPSRYVLVDGNPTGLKDCEEQFARYFPTQKSIELVESLIEEFKTDELFDLVICEGLIPAQKRPMVFAQHVAQFTKPGGICIVTCHDPVGMLTDLLRCLIGAIVIREGMSLEEKTDILVAVFQRHLSYLKGMTRPHRDWVIDQIINTSLWRDGEFFSIADAIEALGGSFDVYGSSPKFLNDWRWYKEVHGKGRRFNTLGRECYVRHIHNFIDYRFECGPGAVERNAHLLDCCQRIWMAIKCYGLEHQDSAIAEVINGVGELEGIVRTFSPDTADALADYMRALNKYPSISQNTDWGRFAAFWGRGMQYLSFIRNR